MHFQHITTDDGLTDNAITCVFEDHAGYIWIGTEHGLNRYDGQRVEQFPAGIHGPEGRHITSVAQDGRDRLWITTADGGLSMRDPINGTFTHYRYDSTDSHSIPSDLLNHVLVWNDTLLFISSRDAGLIRFNPERGSFTARDYRDIHFDPVGDTIAYADNGWCHSTVRVDAEHVWLTHIMDARTLIIDVRDGEVHSRHATLGPDSLRMLTNGCLLGSSLFAGGWQNGISRIRCVAGGAADFLPLADEVSSMVPWDDGLLAATKNNGLVRLDTSGRELARYRHDRNVPSSLSNDHVRQVFVDRAKNIWVATGHGLNVHAPTVWRMHVLELFSEADRMQPDLTFHALQQDPDGTIRISTSSGFFLVRSDHVSQVLLRDAGKELEVTGLFSLSDDLHYVGTETGIYRYSPNREALDPVSKDFIPQLATGRMYQVRSLHLDTVDGRPKFLLCGLGYGVQVIDLVSGVRSDVSEFTGYRDSAADMIRSMQKDPQGTYWAATMHGVMRWVLDPGGASSGAERYSKAAGTDHLLPGDDASSLILHDGTVWIALRDAGLASITNGKAHAHVPPAHLPHDVLGVAFDRAGRAWCTTGNGLLCFDPRSNAWSHVLVLNGVRYKELGKCILTLADGSIAFCTSNALIRFQPEELIGQEPIPVPRIVEVRNTWGPLSLTTDARMEIPYRSSAFDAVITALRPVGPVPLVFVYRLEGVETEWRTTDARSPIRYAGVPVGTYRLVVKVRDAFGREGPEHALLIVTVTGPFWQRWWFFLLVLGAGALGMYFLSRLRQRQRKRLQGVRDRIARDLHDDIGSTLGSISFYSEALKRKLENADDGTAQEVAQKIGTSSRAMIDQMSDIVWSVDPKNDDAGSLVERMHAFAGDLLSAQDIALHFTSADVLSDQKLSAEKRRNLFLIFKEALHNCVKYAACKAVYIDVRILDRSLLMEVRDDGKGFDPENTDSYNGNGVPNMRARARSIHAHLTIDSAVGKGTCLRVSAPLAEGSPPNG
jgi:signal transduction histidine kinase